LGAAFYFAAVLSSLLPILIMVAGTVYVLLVLIPDAIFLYASYRLLRDSSSRNAMFIKRLSLLGMFTGLIAFILGGYYRG
jgi:4-hydroxybenzoate polyprenyltransferase